MSDVRPLLALDRLDVGAIGRIERVDGSHVRDLMREGLLPGALVRVRSRAPLRGPVIVEVGRGGCAATVALSRGIAAGIRVAPESGAGG